MANRKLNLEAEMVKKRVSRDDLCVLLGISYPTLHAKIIGKTEFKCDEMFSIKQFLKTEKTLDELFE